MLMNQFQALDDEDMVCLLYPVQTIGDMDNYQVRDFYEKLRGLLNLISQQESSYHWLGEGIECRLLKESASGEGWLRGKIRLSLAFQEDERTTIIEQSTLYLPEHGDALEIMDPIARLYPPQSSLIVDNIKSIRKRLRIDDPRMSNFYWLDRGIECKVLKAKGEISGWQKGLIRLQLEFLSENMFITPENTVVGHSALESLRQSTIS